MALINCPECNHQVSDKAISCPNCGYPISSVEQTTTDNTNVINNNVSNNKSYCVLFKRLGRPNKLEVIKEVRIIGNYDLKTAKDMVDFPPSVIIKNISQQTAKEVQARLDLLDVVTSIEELPVSENQNNHEQEMKIKKILDDNKDDSVRCPRCGSSAITTGQRGFSFWTGFLGSNKTVNRCAKCGYDWQPK